MYIQMLRLKDDGKSTIGTFSINGEFETFTLEDTHNEPKVYGKTRIPSGEYKILLRKEGRMNLKYQDRYTEHRGMLWLQDVPNFEWVYIHVGNTEDDTDGCILLGDTCVARKDNQAVQGSSLAYHAFYKKVIEAMDRGEEITIHII